MALVLGMLVVLVTLGCAGWLFIVRTLSRLYVPVSRCARCFGPLCELDVPGVLIRNAGDLAVLCGVCAREQLGPAGPLEPELDAEFETVDP